MKPAVKRAIGITIPVLVSAALVYWLVRDISDPERIWNAFWTASPPLLAALVPLRLLSHFLRATRWRRFIGEKVSLYFSFSSLMIGYAVNGVVPRGGEVVRVVNMNRMTLVPVAKLVTTLVTERLLDLVVLLGLIGTSMYALGDQVAEVFPALKHAAPAALVGGALGFIGLAVLGLFSEPLARLSRSLLGRTHPRLGALAEKLIRQAAAGLAFARSKRQVLYVFLETVGIWGLYIVCFGVGLLAYDLFDQVGYMGTFIAHSMTSASALVPSAGQFGTFHKFATDTLTLFFWVNPARCIAFVTVLHLFLFYCVDGTTGLLLWIGQSFVRRVKSRRSLSPPSPVSAI